MHLSDAFGPEDKKSTLYLEIVEAEHLKAADSNGKSDPYAVYTPRNNSDTDFLVCTMARGFIWTEKPKLTLKHSKRFEISMFFADWV